MKENQVVSSVQFPRLPTHSPHTGPSDLTTGSAHPLARTSVLWAVPGNSCTHTGGPAGAGIRHPACLAVAPVHPRLLRGIPIAAPAGCSWRPRSAPNACLLPQPLGGCLSSTSLQIQVPSLWMCRRRASNGAAGFSRPGLPPTVSLASGASSIQNLVSFFYGLVAL